MQEETKVPPIVAQADIPAKTNKGLSTTQKYKDKYQLHEAIHDGVSIEDITALLSSHHNPTDRMNFWFIHSHQ